MQENRSVAFLHTDRLADFDTLPGFRSTAQRQWRHGTAAFFDAVSSFDPRLRARGGAWPEFALSRIVVWQSKS